MRGRQTTDERGKRREDRRQTPDGRGHRTWERGHATVHREQRPLAKSLVKSYSLEHGHKKVGCGWALAKTATNGRNSIRKESERNRNCASAWKLLIGCARNALKRVGAHRETMGTCERRIWQQLRPQPNENCLSQLHGKWATDVPKAIATVNKALRQLTIHEPAKVE